MLVFVGIIWAVFLLDVLIPLDFNRLGVVPRSPFGVLGIPLMPFLHANVGHLASNTIPLLVLLTLLAGSKARSWEIVGEIVFVGGILLWIFGRSSAGDGGGRFAHVGASGLIFGLIAFLILSGFLERRVIPLTVSVVVALLYGGTLLSGVLPSSGPYVSWDGHLCGAIAGGTSAYFLTKAPRQEGEPDEE